MTGPGLTPPAVKSPPQTIRDLEAALRELGYSQRQAKAIAASGFRAITTEQEPELSGLTERIKSLAGHI